jgi:hypothetical protein
MSGEDKVIGERLSRAAIVYDSITKATARLDQAKALAVKDSVAGKLAGEATDTLISTSGTNIFPLSTPSPRGLRVRRR